MDAHDDTDAHLNQAAEADRRARFLRGLADDFFALRANPQAWTNELAERDLWDATLADDLNDE